MRLIDADEIRIKPEYMHNICSSVMIRVEDIARILNDMPTISPEPDRKRGKWIYFDPNGFKCSECGGYLEIGVGDVKMNFCPNCGADMRGEQE